jgi:hypothetical protein
LTSAPIAVTVVPMSSGPPTATGVPGSDPSSWGQRPEGGGPSDPTGQVPAPGELHIKERRSWKTWQLITAMVVAALFGMWVNYDSKGSAATTVAAQSNNLPPPASTGATTTVPSSGGGAGDKTGTGGKGVAGPTTTAPAGSVTTTTAPTTSQTTTPGQPLQLILPATQMQGNWTSPSFSITVSPWNIGWAFQCTPAPASGPAFQVFAAPAGGSTPTTPVVNESGASGQSITTATSLGSQVLVVKSPANCEWAVKVTGY